MAKAKPDPNETVGDRIRHSRLDRGWTQQDLADAVGVSRSAVAQWETDRAGQLRDNLGRIAGVLGVSSELLLRGRETQTASGDELALLRLYRAAAPDDRQLLLRTAKRLVKG
jgi:transcriptional regulator with XRE-family HTH domain